MKDDPIVAEVRKARQRHAARFNYDLDAIVAHLKREEAKHKERLVTRSPKRFLRATGS